MLAYQNSRSLCKVRPAYTLLGPHSHREDYKCQARRMHPKQAVHAMHGDIHNHGTYPQQDCTAAIHA